MLPRSLMLLIVACAALAGPQAAGAHSRAPAAALDYRLRLTPVTAWLNGVHVQVLDGDRALRLKAEPSVALIVLGLGASRSCASVAEESG